MTTHEDGALPAAGASAGGRHAALVLGSKVTQWPLVLGSFNKARSWPPLWPLNFLWTISCSGMSVCSVAPMRTTYLAGSLPNLEEREGRKWQRSKRRGEFLLTPCWRCFQHVPADAVCGRQRPAGVDQGAATDGTANLFLRLKPHWHLPRPCGPDRGEEKAHQNSLSSILEFLKPVYLLFCFHVVAYADDVVTYLYKRKMKLVQDFF